MKAESHFQHHRQEDASLRKKMLDSTASATRDDNAQGRGDYSRQIPRLPKKRNRRLSKLLVHRILLWRNAQPAPRDKDACHESGGSRVHSVCGYAVTSHHDHQHVIIHIERQIDERIGENGRVDIRSFPFMGITRTASSSRRRLGRTGLLLRRADSQRRPLRSTRRL